MQDPKTATPDSSAIRVALWRALHLEVDAEPHVLNDALGMQLAAPDANWRNRPDMHPEGTRGYSASIVGRARFIEDLVAAQADTGVAQYVILGAGLDTFAQRRPEIASRLHVYEVDQPGTQAWKRQRLAGLGFREQAWLRFVPVDLEAESRGGRCWQARASMPDSAQWWRPRACRCTSRARRISPRCARSRSSRQGPRSP